MYEDVSDYLRFAIHKIQMHFCGFGLGVSFTIFYENILRYQFESQFLNLDQRLLVESQNIVSCFQKDQIEKDRVEVIKKIQHSEIVSLSN